MARLVLGAVGAVAGFMAGGPSGAAWGWTIGGMVGGLVDPQVIEQQGPRMSDTKMQFSSWGTMIPIVYGSMRMAGNVIDASDIRETSTTTSEGGKGGPEVETTTYSYDVDLAIGLCEGEIIGIRKIWAYGNLIYNAGDDADLQTLIASQENQKAFKVYTGSETQMPDSTLEAVHGAGNVPAYRGLAYVVFENFQLSDYGNRVPNFEFEVVRHGAYRGQESFIGTISTPTQYGVGIGTVAFSKSEILAHVPQWDANYATSLVKIYRVSQLVPVLVGTYNVENQTHLVQLGQSDQSCLVHKDGPSGRRILFYYGSATGYKQFVLPITSTSVIFCKYGDSFYIAPSAAATIYRYRVKDGALVATNSTALPTNAYCITRNANSLYAICYGGTGQRDIYRFDPNTLELLEIFQTPNLSSNTREIFGDGSSDLYLLGSATSLYKRVGSGWELWMNFASNPAAVPGYVGSTLVRAGFADGSLFRAQNVTANRVTKTYIGQVFRLLSPGASTPVGDIVSDVCARSGLSAIDVAALTDLVHGYALTRPATGRQNIEPLQQAFFFDAVESDNVLKFVKRGAGPAVTIPFDDLAAVEYGGSPPNPIDVQRVQDVELPQRVTINFPNKDSDYQVGSESARRMVTPSNQQLTLELAIAMDADKAAQIADVLMYQAHMARTKFGFSTTRKYAAVEPTDVITVDGKTAQYLVRIVSKNEVGGLIRFEAENEGAATYTSTAVGSSDIPPQEQITVPGPTRLELLDIPILRDVDDDAGLYAAMGSLSDGWRGASLFRSPDDMAYVALDTALNTVALGGCDTVLGNWAGANFFDETNTLTVTLTSGELVSRSRAEILNFENAMLVGAEIIQFRDAVLIGEKQYRLSGLLRGRRGTEQHIGTHQAGERVVLLSMAGTLRPNEGPSAIGAQRYYKPVSIRNTLAQTVATSYANQAVGLKPYAPVRLRGGKQVNGDFLLQWTRRTRIDGGWRNSVNVPLGEALEQYEVDIMSGTTVKRTLTSSTPNVTYTAAQQTTDFGAVQTTLSIRVYQISAVVGRGFQASKTY